MRSFTLHVVFGLKLIVNFDDTMFNTFRISIYKRLTAEKRVLMIMRKQPM